MRPIPNREDDETESVEPTVPRVTEKPDDDAETAEDDESWIEAQEF